MFVLSKGFSLSLRRVDFSRQLRSVVAVHESWKWFIFKFYSEDRQASIRRRVPYL
jgi:hypothetical protein